MAVLKVVLVSMLAGGMVGSVPLPGSITFMQTSERINYLASPEHMFSEADARTYVDAVADQRGMKDPSFEAIEERIARAEYLVLRQPGAGIPEQRVAHVFNLMMAEIGAPPEMRVTAIQVHNFRQNFSAITRPSVYPNMFARRSDGTLDDHCRPVEALYLIYLLQYGPNVEASMAEPIGLRSKGTTRSFSRGGLAVRSPRESNYAAAVQRYFQEHSESEFEALLNRALDELLGSGISQGLTSSDRTAPPALQNNPTTYRKSAGSSKRNLTVSFRRSVDSD